MERTQPYGIFQTVKNSVENQRCARRFSLSLDIAPSLSLTLALTLSLVENCPDICQTHRVLQIRIVFRIRLRELPLLRHLFPVAPFPVRLRAGLPDVVLNIRHVDGAAVHDLDGRHFSRIKKPSAACKNTSCLRSSSASFPLRLLTFFRIRIIQAKKRRQTPSCLPSRHSFPFAAAKTSVTAQAA